jgi:hypothetical protein
MMQSVSKDNLYNYKLSKPFQMIDNYVYLYHTDTLIAIPLYPETITDSMEVQFSPTTPMLRSAPIFTYSNSGPRSLAITLPLHRDMMQQINTTASKLNVPLLEDEDYVDRMINELQSAALPRYASAEKMVNPPLAAIRFGDSIFCKGVISGSVTAEHSGPILTTNKYACVTISFTIQEVDPYDAETVMLEGGFRGIRKTLDARIYK